MGGGGEDCHDPKPILGLWKFTIMEKIEKTITLEFDLVDRISPLIIGLDEIQYADTCKRANPRNFSIQRPEDTFLYIHNTYMAKDEKKATDYGYK